MNVLSFPPARRPVPRQPPPRRLSVTINAIDRHVPYGRTKIFRLSERDFEQLVDTALRLEVRSC